MNVNGKRLNQIEAQRLTRGEVRAPVLAGLVGIVVLVVAGAYWVTNRSKPAPPPQPPSVETTAVPDPTATQSPSRPPTRTPSRPPGQASTPIPPPLQEGIPPAEVPAAPAPGRQWPEASGYNRRLVSNLSGFLTTGGPLTEERVAAWKGELAKLTAEGAAGAYAIREFLEQGKDVDLRAIEGGDALGYPSLRVAMLDALNAIGGPEALQISLDTLGGAVDPQEVAILARNLEQQAPGQYQSEILGSTKAALAKAAQQGSQRDVNPLFEVLQGYVGPGAVPELEAAIPSWRYYATMALASSADGAGIPSLIQMATSPDATTASSRNLALSFLAQLSADSPEARVALVQQAQGNTIPPSAWLDIASSLGGAQHYFENEFFESELPAGLDPSQVNHYNIRYNNQNFYTVNRADRWTQDQVQQQVSLIDQLRSSTTDPGALQALDKAKANLLPPVETGGQ